MGRRPRPPEPATSYDMRKKTITKNERLQLLGLLTIGRMHNEKCNEARDAAYELLGYAPGKYEGDSGHIDDALYDGNNISADALLKRLKITIKR